MSSSRIYSVPTERFCASIKPLKFHVFNFGGNHFILLVVSLSSLRCAFSALFLLAQGYSPPRGRISSCGPSGISLLCPGSACPTPIRRTSLNSSRLLNGSFVVPRNALTLAVSAPPVRFFVFFFSWRERRSEVIARVTSFPSVFGWQGLSLCCRSLSSFRTAYCVTSEADRPRRSYVRTTPVSYSCDTISREPVSHCRRYCFL